VSNTAVFTIVSKNYLPFARTLMQSVETCNPGYQRFVILVDAIDGYFNPGDEPFITILSSDLSIPNSDWVHFKYTILELNTAVKPYAIEHLAKNYDIARLLYFDPDIKVYLPLDQLVLQLDSNDVLLTPHLLEPIDDKYNPGEIDILRSGSYNLGFVALRINEATIRLVRWWQEKLYNHCYVDLARGLFTDQRWMDLVPGIFPNVSIIRHPGYNVAYWNIKQRCVERGPNGYTANQQPLMFFHFSGFDPENPSTFSKHQDRYQLSELNDAARELVLEYAENVLAQGYREAKSWPYAYGTFQNGVTIPDVLRRYALDAPDVLLKVQDPFSQTGYQEFVDYWTSFVPDPVGKPSPLTRLAVFIYKKRADLQNLAPDLFGSGLLAYLDWFAQWANHDYNFGESLMAPMREQRIRVLAIQEHVAASQARKGSSESERAARVAQQLQSIPAPVAALLTSRKDPIIDRLADPASEPGVLLHWINQRASEDSPLTRLAILVYDCRPDLQRKFPDVHGADLISFSRWLVSYGVFEFRLSERLISPIWDVLNNPKQDSGIVDHTIQKSVTRLYILSMWLGFFVQALRSIGDPCLAFRPFLETASSSSDGIGSNSVASPIPDTTNVPRRAFQKIARDSSWGVNIVGYLNSEMGVGEGSRRLADAAISVGLPVSLNNFSVGCLSRKEDDRHGVDNRFLYDVNVFVVNADQTEVLFGNIEKGQYSAKYNIGCWNWELDEFPDYWTSAFERYDEIWVPSTFTLDSVARKSTVPVIRIPYGVEVHVPAGSQRDRLGLPANKFIFLSIFDLLSVIKRKNPEGLIEAFRKVAEHAANCHLVLKINNGRLFPDIVRRLQKQCVGADIIIIDETWSRESVNALIASCNCLVSLHRSEGFGFTIAEAMYLRKPVIATAYSSNLDFTHAHNSLLVDYHLVAIGADGAPYPANGRWAEPNIDSAADAMIRLREDPVLRNRIASAGEKYIREHFSLKVSGTMMLRRLQRILGKTASVDNVGELSTHA
jgi:glycosyltransferase involved in cell wall biosynthesis